MKGKQPENLRTSWIDCAHRMGYFCAENNETSLPFDGLMYRDAVVVAVKLKKVRYSPGEDFHPGEKIPGRGCGAPYPPSPFHRGPRDLAPYPERAGVPSVLRNGRHHRRDRGTYVGGLPEPPLQGGVLEEGAVPDQYPVRKGGEGRERISKNPVKCPDWQTDDPVFRLEWKQCPRP